MKLNQYHGVHGKKQLDAITAAVVASGGTIVRHGPPNIAPFEVTAKTADGLVLDLICYAFTANKYRQRSRPEDEHRFQVKYGSEFDRPHALYIDELGQRTTLFFGVHEEEGLFIAADPAMHNPTWFSSSVEFKQDALDEAKATGWHGWERERVSGGRRRTHPLMDLRTEALLAFQPKHFLTYARLERQAYGLDAGERLLLIDRIGADLQCGRLPKILTEAVHTLANVTGHPLLAQFNINASELLDMIGSNFRLAAAVRGAVAEHHLLRELRETPGITGVMKLDKDGAPDFELTYRRRIYRVECKNVLRRTSSKGNVRVDFQKTRAAKNNPCSRYYSASQFEVLAGCLHPVTERWEFRYRETKALAPHTKCPSKLAEKVVVDELWAANLPSLLDRLTR